MDTYHPNTPQQTKELAYTFAQQLVPGSVICLYGDLGAGKTTFMQGVLEGLGEKRRLISPTFIIMRTYDLESTTLYHADLYRLSGEAEIDGTGLLEALADPRGIVAIEWPDKMGSLLPKKRIDIIFKHEEKENEREIKISRLDGRN